MGEDDKSQFAIVQQWAALETQPWYRDAAMLRVYKYVFASMIRRAGAVKLPRWCTGDHDENDLVCQMRTHCMRFSQQQQDLYQDPAVAAVLHRALARLAASANVWLFAQERTRMARQGGLAYLVVAYYRLRAHDDITPYEELLAAPITMASASKLAAYALDALPAWQRVAATLTTHQADALLEQCAEALPHFVSCHDPMFHVMVDLLKHLPWEAHDFMESVLRDNPGVAGTYRSILLNAMATHTAVRSVFCLAVVFTVFLPWRDDPGRGIEPGAKDLACALERAVCTVLARPSAQVFPCLHQVLVSPVHVWGFFQFVFDLTSRYMKAPHPRQHEWWVLARVCVISTGALARKLMLSHSELCGRNTLPGFTFGILFAACHTDSDYWSDVVWDHVRHDMMLRRAVVALGALTLYGCHPSHVGSFARRCKRYPKCNPRRAMGMFFYADPIEDHDVINVAQDAFVRGLLCGHAFVREAYGNQADILGLPALELVRVSLHPDAIVGAHNATMAAAPGDMLSVCHAVLTKPGRWSPLRGAWVVAVCRLARRESMSACQSRSKRSKKVA